MRCATQTLNPSSVSAAYGSTFHSSPYQLSFFQPLRFWYSAVDDYEPDDASPESHICKGSEGGPYGQWPLLVVRLQPAPYAP